MKLNHKVFKLNENTRFEANDYLDDFGIRNTHCEFIVTNTSGDILYTCIPVACPIKATNYSRNDPIDNGVDVTKEDALELFKKNETNTKTSGSD